MYTSKSIFTGFALALVVLVVTGCCRDESIVASALWNAIDDPLPCDTTHGTPYQSSFDRGYGEIPIALRLDAAGYGLFASADELVVRDLQSGAIVRREPNALAANAWLYAKKIYRYGDLAISAGASSVSAVNTTTGALAWTLDAGPCRLDGDGVIGLDDRYFTVGKTDEGADTFADAVFSGPVASGGPLEVLVVPPYSRQHHAFNVGYGYIGSLEAFRNAAGRSYLLVAYNEVNSEWKTTSFLALYDLDQKTWVYDRRPVVTSLHISGIRQLLISAPDQAWLVLDDRLIHWEISTGRVLSSEEAYSTLLKSATDVQHLIGADPDGRVIVQTYADVQVFGSDGALQYAVTSGYTTWIDAALDRLFVVKNDAVSIYELSSGQLLHVIQPSCDGEKLASFDGGLFWWSDVGGLHLAVTSSEKVYGYTLVP